MTGRSIRAKLQAAPAAALTSKRFYNFAFFTGVLQMSSIVRLRTSLALLVLVIAACVIAPQHVIAQEEPRIDRRIEQLRWIPPDPNLVHVSDVKFALRMLRWHIQRGEMTQLHLQSEIKTLRDEIRQKEEAVRDVVTENTPAQFRFATDAVREQLIGQVLQKLLSAELEVAAHEALVEMLDEQPQHDVPDEFRDKRSKLEDEMFKARERALVEKLKMLAERSQFLRQQVQSGTVTPAEAQKARVAVKEVEGELAELNAERELNKHMRSADVSKRLADVRLETHRLKALEAAAGRQLEELAKAAELGRKWQALQREIEQLNERLLLRVKRLEEVEMETEEAELLLKQVEEAMKEEEPAEADE
jgi:hypothetical protein